MPDIPLNSPACENGENSNPAQSFCIDADRVYDSCGDKDCLSEMRVFFTEANQSVINTAVSVRIREANIINTVVNVEPVTYHCGFYSVDMTRLFLMFSQATVLRRPRLTDFPCLQRGLSSTAEAET